MPLSQAAPFFANSDPDMPAAPVPLEQILEWALQHICAASEDLQQTSLVKDEKPVLKDNGPSENGPTENGPVENVSSDARDVTMVDVATSTGGTTPSSAQTIIVPNGLLHLSKDWRPEGLTFVDGVMRASVLKGEQDIKGGSVKVGSIYPTNASPLLVSICPRLRRRSSAPVLQCSNALKIISM